MASIRRGDIRQQRSIRLTQDIKRRQSYKWNGIDYSTSPSLGILLSSQGLSRLSPSGFSFSRR